MATSKLPYSGSGKSSFGKRPISMRSVKKRTSGTNTEKLENNGLTKIPTTGFNTSKKGTVAGGKKILAPKPIKRKLSVNTELIDKYGKLRGRRGR